MRESVATALNILVFHLMIGRMLQALVVELMSYSVNKMMNIIIIKKQNHVFCILEDCNYLL